MSHEAIYGQPVPGNLHEEMAFTFECSPISLVDRKTMFENWPVCYQSGHVVCTAVGCLQVGSKSCLEWQGPYTPTLLWESLSHESEHTKFISTRVFLFHCFLASRRLPIGHNLSQHCCLCMMWKHKVKTLVFDICPKFTCVGLFELEATSTATITSLVTNTRTNPF